MQLKNTSHLKSLLGNKAKEHQVKSEWVLSYFMMERFLKRLSLSPYKDNFVLKGGMLICTLLGMHYRLADDLDLCLRDIRPEPEEIRRILNEILKINFGDKIQFTLKDLKTLPLEPGRYCFRARLVANFDKTEFEFHIDLTSQDVITPKAIDLDFPCLFDTKPVVLKAYPVESILAEKLQAILFAGGTSSRMVDFYDVYQLSRSDGPGYEPKTLLKAMIHTFKSRDSLDLFDLLQGRLEEIESSKALKSRWKDYQKSYPYARSLSFKQCFKALEEILREILPGKFIS